MKKNQTITGIVIIALFVISCIKNKTNFIDLNYNPNSPEIFAENIISTNLYERDIAISPSGNEIIYTLGNMKQSIRYLVKVTKKDNNWGEREILNISGEFQDIEPFYSYDGNKLYFASNRPMDNDSTRKDYNIWVSKRNGNAWDNPIALDSTINTKMDEFYPSVAKNGNLYFTSTQEDGIGKEDIYLSKLANGNFTKPKVLDTTVNTLTYEFNAYVSPNEDLLVFSSYGREDGLGGGDLYYSRKDKNGKWIQAKHMGSTINSTKLDFCPFIDFERGNFYFTSEKQDKFKNSSISLSDLDKQALSPLNSLGNIYRVSLDSLF